MRRVIACLMGMPHGFGASGDWIPAYDQWLAAVFAENGGQG